MLGACRERNGTFGAITRQRGSRSVTAKATTVFSHPLVERHYALDGRDGADALPYDERNLRQALQELGERQENPS
jgi:hypothetical protein